MTKPNTALISIASLFAASSLLLSASPSWAHTQTYGPLTFELPDSWSCHSDEHNLVCLEQKDGPETSAMVVSYKDSGPDDKLDIYKNQLGQPRLLKDGEVSQPSEVRAIREIDLNGRKWVEAVHYASEIADYYTHYFVTNADPYAILLSISVHKSAYPTDLAKLKSTLDSIKITTPIVAASAPAVAPPPVPDVPGIDTGDQVKAQPVNKKYIVIGGYKMTKSMAMLGVIFIFVVLLLGYAILA